MYTTYISLSIYISNITYVYMYTYIYIYVVCCMIYIYIYISFWTQPASTSSEFYDPLCPSRTDVSRSTLVKLAVFAKEIFRSP